MNNFWIIPLVAIYLLTHKVYGHPDALAAKIITNGQDINAKIIGLGTEESTNLLDEFIKLLLQLFSI